MADLVVRDLQDLVHDLDVLIDQFQGALDWQNAGKGHWGQLNANLTMGDFAANWRIHRDKMVKAMKSFKETVENADINWADADAKLATIIEDAKK
jgi:hypothetical protein